MLKIYQNINKDNNYKKIVNYILDNNEFNKLKTIEHHGITRYEHSLKVSYYSYKVAKALKLDYREVARGGLLHDFFLSNDERTLKDRFISTFVHPKKAEKKAKEVFSISDKEADIIRGHMFPINITVPKYFESWVVNIVDKVVAVNEFGHKFSKQIKYATNVYILFLINFLSNL